MSFAAVSAIIAGITSTVTAVSEYEAGQSTKKWDYYNAAVQEQQAAAVLKQSQKEAEKKRVEGQTLMSRQRVLYAMSGLDLSGTPTDVILGTAGEVENDAQLILQKGATGYSNDMSAAALSKGQGDQAALSGELQAGGTLMSGLGKAAGSASQNYQAGSQ